MSAKSGKRSQTLAIPKLILLTARFLEIISPKLLTLFAARLFTTPIRHKMPKREAEMDRLSIKTFVTIKSVNKSICVYRYGSGEQKILLVHGWSGRGTQLVKIADALVALGFSVISFDAPAHGKSAGKTTLMPEFIAAIMQLEHDFGPFSAAVGHSLGGMSLLNAVKRGLNINALATVGSGDVVSDITDDFIEKLYVGNKFGKLLRAHFERKSGETMDSFSAYIAAASANIPVLVIHDNNDYEVPVSAAHHIHSHLKKGELLLTNGLGHRKILGDSTVISKIISFITQHTHENSSENSSNSDHRNLVSDLVPRTTAH